MVLPLGRGLRLGSRWVERKSYGCLDLEEVGGYYCFVRTHLLRRWRVSTSMLGIVDRRCSVHFLLWEFCLSVFGDLRKQLRNLEKGLGFASLEFHLHFYFVEWERMKKQTASFSTK